MARTLLTASCVLLSARALVPRGVSLSTSRTSSFPDDPPRRRRRPGFLSRSSSRSDADGSYDPSVPSYASEADVAAAANELAARNNDNDNDDDYSSTVDLPSEISDSFLQYALSIILGRALPDVRDGLKPVHRRTLYAMDGLGLSPSGPHRKCARVVGEVLGKYHPHGDTAVYDALVRCAQTFATNAPLVDGHGNFGSVDGDPAAAMRYTECRLTDLSKEALLRDVAEDTVDVVPNFDGSEIEPAVLPARVPVLLLNGAAGIAVGMATNVPPHNLGELCDAVEALVGARRRGGTELTDDELFALVPGPDFPTGGILLGTEDARKLYETGRGGVRLRAVASVEDGENEAAAGGRRRRKKPRASIVVTELPYGVNKATLLEKTAALVNDRKLEGIADLRDESDRDGTRVVIELRKDADARVVLNNLLAKTSLSTTFSGNLLALAGAGTRPERLTLRSALGHFLDFRFDTLRRRASHRLGKRAARREVVDALLAALSHVDEVVDVVRDAPDAAAAREGLAARVPGLGGNPARAEAVLKLRLGQLTRLDHDKLATERDELDADVRTLTRLMEDDDAVWDQLVEETREIKTKHAVPRRTRIERATIAAAAGSSGGVDGVGADGISEMDLVKNSRSVIVVTKSGYIKRLPLSTYSSQGRGTRGKRSTRNTDNDGVGGSKNTRNNNNNVDDDVAHCVTCNDHDMLLLATRRGVAHGVRAYKVPTFGRTARGVPLPTVLPGLHEDDVLADILPVSDADFADETNHCVLATEHGWIKRTPLAAFERVANRRTGLVIIGVDHDEGGDRLRWAERCTDDDDVLVGSRRGMATRFGASELRSTGRTSRGVRSMRLRERDLVADVSVLRSKDLEQQYVLVVTARGYGKRVPTDEFRATSRGLVGVIATKFKNAKDDKDGDDDATSCVRVVQEDDEVLLTTTKGIIVRQKVRDIPVQSRTATGVTLQKIDADDAVSSVSIVPKVQVEENESDKVAAL